MRSFKALDHDDSIEELAGFIFADSLKKANKQGAVLTVSLVVGGRPSMFATTYRNSAGEAWPSYYEGPGWCHCVITMAPKEVAEA